MATRRKLGTVAEPCLALALTLVTHSTQAQTEEGTAPALAWTAPERCPDRARVVTAIEGFLGQAFTLPLRQRIALEVTVKQLADASFEAHLVAVTDEGESERRLTHSDCGKLAEAAALVMALAIDPESVRRRQETRWGAQSPGPSVGGGESADGQNSEAKAAAQRQLEAPSWLDILRQPQMTRCPRPVCPRIVCVEPRPTPCQQLSAAASSEERPSWFVSAQGGAQLTSGFMSDAGPALVGALSVGWWERWHVSLSARYWDQETALVADADASVTASLASFGAEACGVPHAAGWGVVSACLGPELGTFRTSADGADMQRYAPARRLWVAISTAVELSLPLGSRLFVHTRAQGGWVAVDPQVEVETADGASLHVASARPLVASLGADLGVFLLQ